MVLPLGLTPKQWERLDYLLVHNHHIIVNVQLLDLSHRYIGDVTRRLLSGQVSIDTDAEDYTRTLTMDLLDPKQELHLDGDAPEDGSIFYTRMFKVIYSVLSPDFSDRFDIPIFCGPLTKANRNGPVLSIEAGGKDKLSMSSVWKTHNYKKGLQKEKVIKSILMNIGGEAAKYIDIVNRKSNPKLGSKFTVNRNTTAFKAAKKLARGMGGAQLFYDGRGVARCRDLPGTTAHTFTDNKDILTYPQVTYDIDSVINAVDVTGGTPKGKKGKEKKKDDKKKKEKKFHYRAVAARNHALSPWNMGRNGKPRYLPEYIEDSSIRTKKGVRNLARKRLRSALIESVDVQFDSLPIPYLEEGDLLRINSIRWSGSFRLKKMTIPLTANGVSTIGYLRRVSPKAGQIRVKKNNTKKRRKRAA